MGADNWAECPKCNETRQAKLKAMRGDLALSYGKVSSEEYLKAAEDLRVQEELPPSEMLREDFRIGMDGDGNFVVSYVGQCTNTGCQWRWTYKMNAQAYPEPIESPGGTG